MKRFIRKNCFETNSSSTHSLTLDNHSKISNLLSEAVDKIDNLHNINEVYIILGLIREAEHLLLSSLGDY